jgi:hypothetical protein
LHFSFILPVLCFAPSDEGLRAQANGDARDGEADFREGLQVLNAFTLGEMASLS